MTGCDIRKNPQVGKIATRSLRINGTRSGTTINETSTFRATWIGSPKQCINFIRNILITEAVYQFYQKHLDRMIRRNEMLWGDFCKPRFNWNVATGQYDQYLDLDTSGYDLRDPNTVVTPTPKTVIPEPENHFHSLQP